MSLGLVGGSPRETPQSETLSESERKDLYAWAAKIGVMLRNADHEELVLEIWRNSRLEPKTKVPIIRHAQIAQSAR